jgi:hypothetical protein
MTSGRPEDTPSSTAPDVVGAGPASSAAGCLRGRGAGTLRSVKRALWCGRRAIDTSTPVQPVPRRYVYAVPSPSAAVGQMVLRRRSRHERETPAAGFQLAGQSAGQRGAAGGPGRGSHAGPADRSTPEARRLRASRNAEPPRVGYPVDEPQTTFAGSLSTSSSCSRQARDHQTPTTPHGASTAERPPCAEAATMRRPPFLNTGDFRGDVPAKPAGSPSFAEPEVHRAERRPVRAYSRPSSGSAVNRSRKVRRFQDPKSAPRAGRKLDRGVVGPCLPLCATSYTQRV